MKEFKTYIDKMFQVEFVRSDSHVVRMEDGPGINYAKLTKSHFTNQDQENEFERRITESVAELEGLSEGQLRKLANVALNYDALFIEIAGTVYGEHEIKAISEAIFETSRLYFNLVFTAFDKPQEMSELIQHAYNGAGANDIYHDLLMKRNYKVAHIQYTMHYLLHDTFNCHLDSILSAGLRVSSPRLRALIEHTELLIFNVAEVLWMLYQEFKEE